MDFIHDDFLLHSNAASVLYHEFAEHEPILDYHSHLPAREIAENLRFENLSEIWLKGDHYKWRAMRANGISERAPAGNVDSYERFLSWARTVPCTLRNPLYHWTHLELKRHFGISDLLDERSAKSIWDRANSLLETEALSPQAILRKFKVRALCTTDDAPDDLSDHDRINSQSLGFRVYPTFRPDKAVSIDSPQAFLPWLEQLSASSNTSISKFPHFLDALKKRHDAFHAAGARLSDHGLPHCYATPSSDRKAALLFEKTLAGKPAAPEDQEAFASCLMLFFGRLDAEKGWTKQLHLGALRNTNTRALRELGRDAGFDSIGDSKQAAALCAYLDLLDGENALPKTIVYNVNPVDNYSFASAIGNFQDGKQAGKVQFGAAWWFLDQKEGIEAQLNALSNNGL